MALSLHLQLYVVNKKENIGTGRKWDKDGSLYKETGVHLVKPPNAKVLFPKNVDPKTLHLTCNDFCDIPMEYLGIEEQGHELKMRGAVG